MAVNSEESDCFSKCTCCMGRKSGEEDDVRLKLHDVWGDVDPFAEEPLLRGWAPAVQVGGGAAGQKGKSQVLLSFGHEPADGTRQPPLLPWEAVSGGTGSNARTPPLGRARLRGAMDVASDRWDGWREGSEALASFEQYVPPIKRSAYPSGQHGQRQGHLLAFPGGGDGDGFSYARAPGRGALSPEREMAARVAAVALLTPISVDSVLSPGLLSQKSTAVPVDSGCTSARQQNAVALLTPMSVETLRSPEQPHMSHGFMPDWSAVELRTPESVFTEIYPGHVDVSPSPGSVTGDTFEMGIAAARRPRPGVVARLFP